MISQSEKTNPISEKPKMNANAFSQKDYENKTALRHQKNKPNQTQFQRHISSPKEWQENKAVMVAKGPQTAYSAYKKAD
jgi:hypothetical protein